MHTRLTAMVLFGLLAGCKQPGATTGGTTTGGTTTGGTTAGGPMPDLSMAGPPPIGSRIELASTKQNLQEGVTATSFSFFNQSELWVRVITPAMPKATQLHLKFFSPKGLLIYDDESAFTTDPGGGKMMMMGEPIDMQVVKSISGGSALDRGLPL